MRSLLLRIFYSVRSERMLIEQLQYNLLFRWFVGMEMDEAVWNHAVFSKNRERLLNEEIAEGFFRRVLERAKPYMSDEHFTVDGTLIEAWASQKSFRRKDGKGNEPGAGGEVDFHGEKRKNQTHESTTDPDARLFKKSKGSEAKLSYLGHVLMENRNGLLLQTFLTEATQLWRFSMYATNYCTLKVAVCVRAKCGAVRAELKRFMLRRFRCAARRAPTRLWFGFLAFA